MKCPIPPNSVITLQGYGETANNTDIWEPGVKYFESQLENYFEWEMKVLSLP